VPRRSVSAIELFLLQEEAFDVPLSLFGQLPGTYKEVE